MNGKKQVTDAIFSHGKSKYQIIIKTKNNSPISKLEYHSFLKIVPSFMSVDIQCAYASFPSCYLHAQFLKFHV